MYTIILFIMKYLPLDFSNFFCLSNNLIYTTFFGLPLLLFSVSSANRALWDFTCSHDFCSCIICSLHAGGLREVEIFSQRWSWKISIYNAAVPKMIMPNEKTTGDNRPFLVEAPPLVVVLSVVSSPLSSSQTKAGNFERMRDATWTIAAMVRSTWLSRDIVATPSFWPRRVDRRVSSLWPKYPWLPPSTIISRCFHYQQETLDQYQIRCGSQHSPIQQTHSPWGSVSEKSMGPQPISCQM